MVYWYIYIIVGSHKISVWELDAMCLQMEREDIIRVYLHTNQSFGCLTSLEQEAIINQADSKLKVAKGRAMLPQITKKDVYDLLKVSLNFLLYSFQLILVYLS